MDQEMIECLIREEIDAYCSCPKVDCERHGLCCRCIVEHKNRLDAEFIKRFPHCLRGLVEEVTG